jgi:hypothetical protein
MERKMAFQSIGRLMDGRITEEQTKQVWDAFMQRCSISMVEPDKSGWTNDQHQLWKFLWESDLNPF